VGLGVSRALIDRQMSIDPRTTRNAISSDRNFCATKRPRFHPRPLPIDPNPPPEFLDDAVALDGLASTGESQR
jgi:hypothetical protein